MFLSRDQRCLVSRLSSSRVSRSAEVKGRPPQGPERLDLTHVDERRWTNGGILLIVLKNERECAKEPRTYKYTNVVFFLHSLRYTKYNRPNDVDC